MKLVLLFFSLLFFSSIINANQGHTLVGKIHELSPDDSRNIYGYQFYLSIEDSKGRSHAYPIRLKEDKPRMKELIRQNKEGQFIVKARTSSARIKPLKGKERGTQIVELVVSQVKPMNLKNLGFAKMEPYQPKGVPISKKHNVKMNSPGTATITGVNDTFTNAAIAAGAAVLLGSILLGK